MKIIALYAAVPSFEQGLNNISQVLKDTFIELGVGIEEISLATTDIHFFDGTKSRAVDNILQKIEGADGVIIQSCAVLSMPCGIMQTFIEHLGFNAYKNPFLGKRCFFVTVSSDGSEKKACDYITSVIADFGGIDVGKITACDDDAYKAISDSFIREAIEKYAEDLYRVLKQERNFILPGKKSSPAISDSYENETLKKNISKTLGFEPAPKKIKSSEILKQIDYDSFNMRQEEDINEISKFLANEYNSEKNASENNFNPQQLNLKKPDFDEEIVPHIKSCRQKTQSLYHYFQPQLSVGVDAVIQFYITGAEDFEGYFIIRNCVCEYKDGIYSNPDVTVFSETNIWLDILNGKYSIQKAFMIGQLKVKGNFVIMTKFDQLFKMQK